MSSKEARKRYRERHPERDRENRRAAKARWIARNREKHLESARQRVRIYRQEHPEKVRTALQNWYEANRYKVRSQQLKKKFGLTAEAWDAKFELQGRRCGCCGSADPLGKKGWQTDHCHTTGRLRDILCVKCNLMLTRHLQSHIAKAIEYLKRHGSPT